MKASTLFFWISIFAVLSLTQMSCGKDADPILPSVNFSVTTTDLMINEELQFNNNTTLAETYAWDFGDGTSSTLANPIHSYSNIGTYTVTLVATNMDGSANFSMIITVHASIFPGERVDDVPVGATLATIKNKLGNPYDTRRIYYFGTYYHFVEYSSGLEFAFVTQSGILNDSQASLAIFIESPFIGTTAEGLGIGTLRSTVDAELGQGISGGNGWYNYSLLGIDFHYVDSPSKVDVMMVYAANGFNGEITSDMLLSTFLQNE